MSGPQPLADRLRSVAGSPEYGERQRMFLGIVLVFAGTFMLVPTIGNIPRLSAGTIVQKIITVILATLCPGLCGLYLARGRKFKSRAVRLAVGVIMLVGIPFFSDPWRELVESELWGGGGSASINTIFARAMGGFAAVMFGAVLIARPRNARPIEPDEPQDGANPR